MSAKGYIDRAIKNLSQAVDQQNREISDLQTELKQLEMQTHKEVRHLESKIYSQYSDLSTQQNNDVEAFNDIREVKQMKDEIKNLEQKEREEKDRIEQKIRQGEDLVRAIESRKSDLGSLAR